MKLLSIIFPAHNVAKNIFIILKLLICSRKEINKKQIVILQIKKEFKMKFNRVPLALLIILGASCSAVNSSELNSTKASDLRLEADIREYNGAERAEVGTQLRTSDSDVAINFDSGESLKVNHGNIFNPDESIFLSSNQILNLDRDYEGVIPKSPDGYAITYTDKDGEQTTIHVETSFAPELEIEDNNIIGGIARMRWNPEGITGRLKAVATYSGAGVTGYRSKWIENTGSYDFDVSIAEGQGHIRLEHINTVSNLEGFKESLVTIYNADSVEVSFNLNDQLNQNPDNQRALVVNQNPDELIDRINNRLDQCLRICEEGEVDIFEVENLEFSCCE